MGAGKIQVLATGITLARPSYFGKLKWELKYPLRVHSQFITGQPFAIFLLFNCFLKVYCLDDLKIKKRTAGFLLFHIACFHFEGFTFYMCSSVFNLHFLTYRNHIFIANTLLHSGNIIVIQNSNICFGFRACVLRGSMHFIYILYLYT